MAESGSNLNNETNQLEQVTTVNFHDMNKATETPELTVTYSTSTLSVLDLRRRIGDYINEDETDIILIHNDKILRHGNYDIEMKENISIKYFVAKENEEIISYSEYRNRFIDASHLTSGEYAEIFVHESRRNEEKVIKLFENVISSHKVGKIKQILNEVSNLTQLSPHPHVVQFIEFNRVGYDSLMIVIEYMEGGSLCDYIGNKGKLSEREVKYYLIQILRGLNYLHENRIIHGHLKCANIFLNEDFTICKLGGFERSRRIQTGDSFTTVSVESTSQFVKRTSQFVSHGVSVKYNEMNIFKRDIWLLGEIIVEMLTGEFGLPRLRQDQALTRARNSGTLSDEMNEFISMCKQSNPDIRPSAQDLLGHDLLKLFVNQKMTRKDVKLQIATILKEDVNLCICGFNGHDEVILESDSLLLNCDEDKFISYYFLMKMEEFEVLNEIEEELFECINNINRRRYHARRIKPFYLTEFTKSSFISEIIKMKEIDHDNIMKIVDIRSDGEDLFCITNVIEGTEYHNFCSKIESVCQMKFLCGEILQGFVELIRKKIKISVKVWICNNLKCQLTPVDFSHTCNMFHDPEDSLDGFYAYELLSIIRLHSSFPYYTSEVKEFVFQFNNHLKSLIYSEDQINIVADVINSEFFRSDSTVQFIDITSDSELHKLTVTYFTSTLSDMNLRRSIGDFINEDERNIILIMDTSILKYGSGNIEIKDFNVVKYFVIRESKSIQAVYAPDSEYFEGLLHSNYIASGGFGQIYVHQLPGSNHKVAIKLFRNIMSNHKVDKVIPILKEVSLFMKLSRNPHVVQFLEFNRIGYDNLMIQMEFMEGGSLNDYIKLKGRLCDTEVKYFLRQIISGLHYLHSNMVVHLDIKCDNILVNGDFTICKLTDFGISRKLKSFIEFSTETIVSTRNFQSPELLGKLPIKYGIKADIWSLGGVIVEMTTGQPPFSGVTYWMITTRVMNGKKIQYCTDGVSDDMINLINLCTQFEPQDRPSTQELLQHDLLQ